MDWLHWYFWSPVRDGENSAQTIVRVLGNFARWALLFVVAIALLVAVLLLQSASTERQRRAVLAGVEGSVVHAPETCGADYPLLVGFINHNRFPVANVTARVSANRPGRTTNLITGWSPGRIVTDDIIDPDDGFGRCYTFELENPSEFSELEWTVSVTHAVKWPPD